MQETFILSRKRLADFAACRRRFQLRYVERLAWPAAPVEETIDEAILLGKRFHQLAQRYYMGLPADSADIVDAELRRMWERFVSRKPALPPGRRYPEVSMTVPIGRHFLTGRFDLLILGEGRAHVFDWKTDARARSAAQLREDLQTLLYLALATEGSPGLNHPLAPEQVALTFWYVNDPESSATFEYGRAQHDANWSYIRGLASELDRQAAAGGVWALTNDLDHCAQCAYQLFCDRQLDRLDLSEWEPDDEALSLAEAPSLEPQPR